MRAALALCLILPAPALAETPMTAEEFEAYVTGKTMDYIADGQVFGREVYLPGRKVRWAFTAEECKLGHWFGQGDQICFLYDGDPEPKCWMIWSSAPGTGGRLARLAIISSRRATASRLSTGWPSR